MKLSIKHGKIEHSNLTVGDESFDVRQNRIEFKLLQSDPFEGFCVSVWALKNGTKAQFSFGEDISAYSVHFNETKEIRNFIAMVKGFERMLDLEQPVNDLTPIKNQMIRNSQPGEHTRPFPCKTIPLVEKPKETPKALRRVVMGCGVELLDFLDDQAANANTAQAIIYMLRAGDDNNELEDLETAKAFLDREIDKAKWRVSERNRINDAASNLGAGEF